MFGVVSSWMVIKLTEQKVRERQGRGSRQDEAKRLMQRDRTGVARQAGRK
jgi:hypothetical protein